MRLVIFGTGLHAEIADYYFGLDTQYEVVAFTVDRQFVKAPTFRGRPVVAFEDLADRYPAAGHHAFVALGYSRINGLRMEKYHTVKEMGFRMASYVSPRATVFPNVELGDNVFLLEDNTVQPFVTIGSNVTLWSGNHIGHHSRIDDHCFISSHVVVSGNSHIGPRCFVGVNATLRDGLTVGAESVIGAGALVLEDAPKQSVYPAAGTARSKVPSSRLRRI